MGPSNPCYKLVFHVPPSALAACKEAIFAAGAGRHPYRGNYTECCWAVLGTGQFLPGPGANPHIGTVGQLQEVEEYRVETMCIGRDVVRATLRALIKAHPYEKPVYDVFKIEEVFL